MTKNDYIIRLETKRDYNKTENLVRESFWNVYRPGCSEHFVLKCLRNDADFVPQLDFVMEKDGQIIGQIIFVKAAIAKNDGGVLPVLTFGHLCIEKSNQKKDTAKFCWIMHWIKPLKWVLALCLLRVISIFTDIVV